MIDLIEPDWNAPTKVCACSTTRGGGFSQAPYTSFNLGLHVGDVESLVMRNRQLLEESLLLPGSPTWIKQTHSTRAAILEEDDNREIDAAITRQPGRVAVVMTADCLPHSALQ